MSKKKNKKPVLTEDVRNRAAEAAEAVFSALPVSGDEAAALFQTHAAGLAGHEAALVDILAGKRTTEVLAFLRVLGEQPYGREVRKALKKAIYRLEQSGLKTDQVPVQAGAGIYRSPSTPRKPSGYLTEFEPDGKRAALLAVPSPDSGYDVGMFQTDYLTGVKGFNAWHVTSGELNRMVRDLEEFLGVRVFEVPAEGVRYILSESVSLARKKGVLPTEELQIFLEIASRIRKPDKPLIYDYVPEHEASGPESPESDIPALLDQPFMEGFLYLEDIDPYWEELQDIEDSQLVLSGLQKADRRESWLDRTAKRIFVPEKVRVLIRQIEECALLRWLAGDHDGARQTMGLAALLRKEPDGQAAGVLYRAILVRTLALIEEAIGDSFVNQDETSGGLERPATDSGLIIPG